MTTYKTGDECLIEGNYIKIETGDIINVGKTDLFPPYYKKIGKQESTSLYSSYSISVHYEK